LRERLDVAVERIDRAHLGAGECRKSWEVRLRREDHPRATIRNENRELRVRRQVVQRHGDRPAGGEREANDDPFR
jgi:hypothetical protein